MVAIAHQTRLAIITRLRVAILLHTRLGAAGAHDEKAWAKQEKRQKAKREDPDGTDRPDWTVPLFRYTAKVSRQVLPFFKLCFLKSSRSDPRLGQWWQGQAQAPLGDRLDQVGPGRVAALPAGIDDTGEQGKDP